MGLGAGVDKIVQESEAIVSTAKLIASVSPTQARIGAKAVTDMAESDTAINSAIDALAEEKAAEAGEQRHAQLRRMRNQEMATRAIMEAQSKEQRDGAAEANRLAQERGDLVNLLNSINSEEVTQKQAVVAARQERHAQDTAVQKAQAAQAHAVTEQSRLHSALKSKGIWVQQATATAKSTEEAALATLDQQGKQYAEDVQAAQVHADKTQKRAEMTATRRVPEAVGTVPVESKY